MSVATGWRMFFVVLFCAPALFQSFVALLSAIDNTPQNWVLQVVGALLLWGGGFFYAYAGTKWILRYEGKIIAFFAIMFLVVCPVIIHQLPLWPIIVICYAVVLGFIALIVVLWKEDPQPRASKN